MDFIKIVSDYWPVIAGVGSLVFWCGAQQVQLARLSKLLNDENQQKNIERRTKVETKLETLEGQVSELFRRLNFHESVTRK